MSTATKERPILFSAPMVRAILDDRKTQTRRAIKPQPPSYLQVYSTSHNKSGQWEFYGHGRSEQFADCHRVKCPYGVPGERLWVRETFLWDVVADVSFRADYDDETAKQITAGSGNRWRPSIHMPRWASRITLEITGVRVERLQDISEEDAIAEGCQCAGVPASLTNVGAFAKLWESINGPGSWDANPWLWVVEFKRIEQA